MRLGMSVRIVGVSEGVHGSLNRVTLEASGSRFDVPIARTRPCEFGALIGSEFALVLTDEHVDETPISAEEVIATVPKRRYVPPFDPGGPGLRMGASDESEDGDE